MYLNCSMYVCHILMIGYTYSINSLVIHVLIPVYFESIAGNNFFAQPSARFLLKTIEKIVTYFDFN